ncbi:hypothetical protein Q9R19_00890 [Microbacterium sp. ARD32]|uniref:hypothetical protein n=1 Tax=Microbacterium sp. ARD32 TaxID=2962577 RepID=UPI002881B14D|nr:hypothetical protein [Microbacterium sp. ARD32]MDT0156174.1 hypothetical protein [Microbacterium sp. ARD32]
MSRSRLRFAPVMLALAAVALLASGCSATPASPVPTSTPSPREHRSTEPGDLYAAWLDGGRMIGIVTWGSSTPTCQPFVQASSADGQDISVELTYPPEASDGCNSDLRLLAHVIGVADGVDASRDVRISIRDGDESGSAALAGFADQETGVPDQAPTAGWFADDGILLLTYGSSSCPPEVDEVERTDAGATVRFASRDRMCTMDLAPRVTPIVLPDPVDRDVAFVLTLQGDNLDGEVRVRG